MASMLVLLVGVGALAAIFTSALSTSEVQGRRMTATAVYAQDKMEELMQLSFKDTSSNLTVFPPSSTGGTGLLAGGGITAGAPVAGYADYLDSNGVPSAAPGFYKRQWQITDDPATGSPAAVHAKTITVAVYGQAMNANQQQPSTILVSVKSDVTW
jgi:hypothetical protein